jgi:hypothetical protein
MELNQSTCLFSSIENDIMSCFLSSEGKNDLIDCDGIRFETLFPIIKKQKII